jgi:uncharacterized repeat protein (TIGR03803 family)
MTSKVQHSCWISDLRRRATNMALTLAAVLLAAVVMTRPAQAQTFTLLHQFAGGTDGGNPLARLVEDTAGNFYGTTSGGGVIGGTCLVVAGCGVVFKLDTSGKETVLYRFTGLADGESPSGGLILDGAGNLYGTAGGGASLAGVVFKLDTAGSNYAVLYSFTGKADGYGPLGSLVLDVAGNLYGATQGGGASMKGTVFKLDAAQNYTETVLYSFTGGADGSGPLGSLVLDPAGNLYGATSGTVFKLDTAAIETVLHSFTGKADGGALRAGVILDPAGNLYGTASIGGALNCLGGLNQKTGCGLVFKLDPLGVETEYNFTRGGDFPVAGLVRDTAGNLYGTTEFAGPHADSVGLVFKMVDTNGAETALFRFADGALLRASLVAGLVLDASGKLYGTTEFGGFYGAGTVFKLDPAGPANFALTVAPAGKGSGTVTGNPPGIDCPSSCLAFFTPGIAVTLTATAAAGSSFSGWSGPCSGTGACNLTTNNSAEVLFATFLVDFALSASALSPGTVSPGASSTSTVKVTAASGFSGAVALSCSVQPTPALAPTCSISPSSTTPGTTATMTVSTTAPTAGASPFSTGSGLFYAVWLPLLGLVAARVGFGSRQNSKGKVAAGVLGCMLFAGLLFQVACGGSNNHGGGSSGTPAGTYTITVTGTDTSGSLKHLTTTMLKVQ